MASDRSPLALLAAWFQSLRRLRQQYLPNPVRLLIKWIGLGLARLGLIDRARAVKTTELLVDWLFGHSGAAVVFDVGI